MRRIVVLAVLVVALVTAAVANADVLVNAVPKTLVCGDAIQLGIWAQAGTTGNRTVRMSAIDQRTGRVWWRRTATAPTRAWRYWSLPSGRNGRCGRTTIVYRGHREDGSSWVARYNVRFRSEGV
jgi:hypothetical protein